MKKEKKDIFPTHLPEIEKTIGYTFRDKSLITQAFTRTSFCNENGGEYQSNEVLEFIGDSVLSVSIITRLSVRNIGVPLRNVLSKLINSAIELRYRFLRFGW